MAKANHAGSKSRTLHSRIAALEQLIEVYEGSVSEQATKLYQEIAQRKSDEEEIKELLLQNRMILESAGEGIYGLDPEGKTTFINPAAARMIGYEPEEIIGKMQHAILHHTRPDGTPYPKEECFIYAALHTGTTHHVEDEVFWRRDGTSFPVEYTSTPIWKQGKVTGAVVVFKDITERRRAGEEIRRLNAELEHKVEERTRQLLDTREELARKDKLTILGQLTGSVSHELRNPLGVMKNAVYFLEMVLADADALVREYLEIIGKEIENSERIITDFLDFTRTKPPQRSEVSVATLAATAVGRCTVPENVTLAVDISDILPSLRVDPLQMGQVLTNLVTNAVQAMPDGGSLRIGARKVSSIEFRVSSLNPEPETRNPKPDGDFIEISVADTGVGIPPENMAKLFQPLFTTKARGTGLGLVVCKNLVEANGGTIKVESGPGAGTSIIVTLPTGGDGFDI